MLHKISINCSSSSFSSFYYSSTTIATLVKRDYFIKRRSTSMRSKEELWKMCVVIIIYFTYAIHFPLSWVTEMKMMSRVFRENNSFPKIEKVLWKLNLLPQNNLLSLRTSKFKEWFEQKTYWHCWTNPNVDHIDTFSIPTEISCSLHSSTYNNNNHLFCPTYTPFHCHQSDQ